MIWSVIAFGLFGSYSLCVQMRMIWKSKSAHSVSGAAAIVVTSFFAGYAIYGVTTNTLPAIVQGVWRALFWAPVAIGFVRYGKASILHLWLGILCLVMLLGLNIPVLRSPIIYAFTCMMISFMWVQAY